MTTAHGPGTRGKVMFLMCRIPCTVRIGGRYVYRRRIHFRNLISKPVGVALRTADPVVARRRAALLSARFVLAKLDVDVMLEAGRLLTGAEIEAIFRQKLEEEISFYVHSAYENAPWSSSVQEVAAQEAEAYRLMRLPGRHLGMTDEDRAALCARGLQREIPAIETYVRQISKALDDPEVSRRLRTVGAPTHSDAIAVARGHLIRAGAAACSRISRVFNEAVLDAPDPIRALMSDLGEPTPEAKALLDGHLLVASSAASKQSPQPGPFLISDERPFSACIDGIIAELRQEKVWKGDCRQQRRILATFAWITGDRALGRYTHLDVEAFKRGLMRLPVTFRFGNPMSGAMSRPFADVIAELPPFEPGAIRNPKTTNRDLSTMSTVAKHLATTAWKPAVPGAVIMDFASATITVRDDGTDLRPPWTRAHMELLFHSPLYLGGNGSKARLHASEPPTVHHDAAYYAPLLWYYHHACREEICGLRADEVNVDHDVPHFVIRDNDVRGRDGEVAGEKRIARRRALPIHPELLRLGFTDYVRAIRRDGHAALFPELYINAAKRGGGQFYAIAWRFLVDWIRERMPLPLNGRGKGPDIHSIRALGSSFYEVDGVNEIIRADVMGHARTGTNAKHYSKRLQTEGLDTVLRERLEFIQRYVPILTADVPAMPLRLLPLERRSRVGSGRHRKMRCDRNCSLG